MKRIGILAAIAIVFLLLAIAVAGERSGKWPAVRDAYTANHPTCEACGTAEGVQVHHVHPFHEYPERELDPKNLITLCPRCHIVFGHLGDFKAWNPCVREDAARHLAEVKARPYAKPASKKFEERFSNTYQNAP